MFAFPNPILKQGTTTDLLDSCGIKTFHEAVNWVWRLPYGRTSDRSNYLLIPFEKKGACSGKHAFLSAVAAEQGVPLLLTIGIFMMNGENTPKINATLKENNLKEIPEAHCYLQFQDERYDFTSFEPGASPYANMEFLYEEIISPDQIGKYKTILHRRWIEEWCRKTYLDAAPDKIWSIRERCIKALEQ